MRWRQCILHTFPHTFHHFPLFTVSTASTFIFRTGGHFPALGDWLRQASLAENSPGGPFLAGDTYLRDRGKTEHQGTAAFSRVIGSLLLGRLRSQFHQCFDQ